MIVRKTIASALLLLIVSGAAWAQSQTTAPPRVQQAGNTTAARIVNKVQPVYPPLARQAKIEGTVRLHAILGVDGQVIILELISGHPLLVQAAMDAVRQWKYGLVLLDGKPVEVDTTVDIIFSLEDTGGSSAQDEASTPKHRSGPITLSN